MFTPKFIVLRRNPPLGNEKVLFPSNPKPNPEFSHLPISGFLVNLAAPKKQFLKILTIIKS